MLQMLQILQLILFFIPVFTLLSLGAVILVKSVSVISRRWFLAVFLPLLIANPLAYIENRLTSETALGADWRLWLVIIADAVLVFVILRAFRGWAVYGFDADQVRALLQDYFRGQGLNSDGKEETRRSLWGQVWEGCVLSVELLEETASLWIIERFNEVHVRAHSSRGACLLKRALASVKQDEPHYDFSRHAVGILYLVLGVVLAVLGWIFFFEPRLILIE